MPPDIQDVESRLRTRITALGVPAETILLDQSSLRQVHPDWWAVNLIAPDSINRTREFFDIIADVEMELDDQGIHVTIDAA